MVKHVTGLDPARKNHALFGHCRGLIWSIMPWMEVGYYLHLTFLFDTDGLTRSGNLNGTLETPLALLHLPVETRPIGTFPEQVGKYLIDLCTDGKGEYFVCHRDPLRYGPEWVPARPPRRLRKIPYAKALSHLAPHSRRPLVQNALKICVESTTKTVLLDAQDSVRPYATPVKKLSV